MDPLLTVWLGGVDERSVVPMLDDAYVSLAREAVRASGTALAMDQELVEQLVLAASELGNNQLTHGRQGHLAVRTIERAGVPGIELVAADLGPGVEDPKRALEG